MGMGITDAVNSFYYHMSLHELQAMNGSDYYNGLSYNSMLYINVIQQMEYCTVSRLSEALRITKSAVTLKINELMKHGAVIKEQSEADKRVFYVKLSPQMRENVKTYDNVFSEIEKDLRTKYTDGQLELFADILCTISGYEWS